MIEHVILPPMATRSQSQIFNTSSDSSTFIARDAFNDIIAESEYVYQSKRVQNLQWLKTEIDLIPNSDYIFKSAGELFLKDYLTITTSRTISTQIRKLSLDSDSRKNATMNSQRKRSRSPSSQSSTKKKRRSSSSH
jgi:hypothetical protein